MPWRELIEEEIEMAKRDGLLERFAPLLDVQSGETLVGEDKRASVALEDERAMHALAQFYLLKRDNALARCRRSGAVFGHGGAAEHEFFQSELYHRLFLHLLSILLRDRYAHIAADGEVGFEMRKGWVVVWYREDVDYQHVSSATQEPHQIH